MRWIDVAVAHHDSGMVAVCGTAPTGKEDVADAMAQIFRPNQPGQPWVGDYQPPDQKPHKFAERVQDCVFSGETLALVGEANGRHGMELKTRDRLLIVRLNTGTSTSAWTVAMPGAKLQSGALAVDIDDLQRLVVAGYTCDDDCQLEADLRIYDERDTIKWQVSLGSFPTKQFAVQDVEWSPAEYAVVATGGVSGNELLAPVRIRRVAPVFSAGEQRRCVAPTRNAGV